MNDAFNDREKGFERKYEFDEQQRFRTQARRDKLFGRWAAGRLGRSGGAAEAYAIDVVDANFERAGDEHMLDKVRNDFAAKNVAVGDKELLAKLAECHKEAARQIAAGE